MGEESKNDFQIPGGGGFDKVTPVWYSLELSLIKEPQGDNEEVD